MGPSVLSEKPLPKRFNLVSSAPERTFSSLPSSGAPIIIPISFFLHYKSHFTMEECHKLGLTKSIGVSNFSPKKLENLLSFATIPPSVNQVEMNIAWQQKNLREYCKAKGITVTAYSPLGAKGTKWDINRVLDHELTKQIAQAHGKTAAQVCLRWLFEQGVTFIPKSYNKDRLKQNIEIFDWSLTKDDHEKINQVKQDRMFKNGPAAFPLPDLFDGET
uniref:NAD(P)H-dependent 6'-deoxychalcone synthase n=1 Tax=Cajanus cajan TaxID=3821 RepID=A0A151R241_CAJCA|nr:NAD(P)H-dependent 6'-deoxychalcone synthase [Cajanus cajan]